MNYELIKELKDNHFPKQDIEYVKPIPGIKVTESITIPGEEGRWRNEPTLEELIEACGDDFDSLVRFYTVDHLRVKSIVKYRAQAVNVTVPDGRGKTPKEAVANLWLHLKRDIIKCNE